MKKYLFILLSSLLLIASFLFCWYSDQLFDLLFIFYLIPIGVLAILFIDIFIISLIKIFKDKQYINIISIIILITIVMLVIFFPFREAKIKFELNFLENKRLEIIDLIRENKLLHKDEIGNVELPLKYKIYSTGGEVFIYKNYENSQVIGFWIVRGMLSDSIELIYSTGGKELINNTDKGHPIKKIDMIKDNWYLVYRSY